MADYLRYTRPGAANPQRSRMPSYVAGLDELEDDDFPVAPPNLSGRTERDVPIEPETPNEEGGQQFQLGQPDMVPDLTSAPRAGGDLRLPGDLAAPRQQLRPPMQGNSRLSFVQGLEPSPEAEEPMPGQKGGSYDPSLTQRALMASEDRSDREASDRARRARIGIGIAGAIGGIFGNTTQAQVAQAAAANDPNAPFEARRASRAAEAEAQAAQAQAQYDREFAQQRLGLDERRIAQGEAATQQRAGYRDADIMPEHPNAENERRLYATTFGALPQHIRETFPGFDPRNPATAEAMQGMGAAQIRRQLELLDDQVMTRFPDEGDWRSTARSGGRARRGQLAGFGTPGTTVRRGDSGVTPEQLLEMDAAGVDEMEAQGSASPAPMPAGVPRGTGGTRVPRQGAVPVPAPTGAQQPPGAPQAPPPGRALVDRPPTQAELAAMPMDMRTTDAAVRAYMSAHVIPSARYAEAAARVNGLTPDQRGQLITEWGNPRMNLVPGFRRVEDTGRMTPQRMGDVREYARTASVAAALSSEVLGLVDRITSLNLAEDALTGHPLVAEALGKARRLQTLLRIVDRTGVPTGTEQERAMQEAPEPLTPVQLIRSRSAYQAMPRSIMSVTLRNMESEGFLPVAPRRAR